MGVQSPPWRGRRLSSPAAFALVVVVLAGQVVAAFDGELRKYILGLSVLLLDALGVVVSLRAGRRGNTVAWQIVSAGRLFSLIGVVTLAASVATLSHGWWWIGVVSRLLMFVLLAAAALVAPAQRLSGRQRYAFAAEAVTVLGAGFMVVWYFVINPAIDGHPPQDLWVAEIGYPIGDLLLLTGAAVVVLRGTISRLSSPLTMYVGGLVCYLVGDAMWSALGVHGVEASESPFAGFFLVIASLLITLSAMLYQPMAPTRSRSRTARASAWSTHLPTFAVAVGGLLLLVVTVRENDMLPWGGLVLGLIVMASAMAARQMFSLRDTRDLVVSDLLTGLANRTGLDNAITRAVKRREHVAVLLIDLDGFKLVNDAYGHAAGDTVLVEFAHHLRSTVRTSDVPARIGGDEFAVLLTEIVTPEHATAAAQRILAAVAANPVRLGEDVLPIRASIGVAIGTGEDSTKDLLRRADVAMYQAKRAGTHAWVLHDPSMIDRRAEDAALSDDLAAALDRGELNVLFQPMVDLVSGRPIGAEALVRWQHPTRGVVSPVRFIPIAERSGIITEIGLFVLEQALLQLKAWRQPLYISVNLSPRQLSEPTIVHDILAVLGRTGMPPESLVLEVTESAIVDENTGIAALRALREHGIRVAIDDFGTGYSSLQYLTRLPVDILKIDRSFVGELNGTPAGSAITEAVIRLSQVLNLTTVAEGIETAEQAAELLTLGCDTGQGYLYARPLPGPDLDDLMTAVRADA
ncbi:putative bifunctional diguanylate cyclase/phosphodiesterase [Actinoplanes friuliensis]|uniref:PAS/PAC and GAF sensor-containing diguanylate cyclase/phosphodiesterase n=1 Tax=Actinoplanes friuliensis DSM 7358 TaxID=1246995 RepID=U5VZ80_9ACTN|nr:bifunctional diguanylate cyclase/phosphodiesterase [Actinoplanes friuliensis]AGZ42293.1 PAS/PAC and GAF sensor-containing diguanylate cyclase/phosphodiesterase [Actinoplanes friuliensis DSM 7358]